MTSLQIQVSALPSVFTETYSVFRITEQSIPEITQSLGEASVKDFVCGQRVSIYLDRGI